MCIKSVNKEIIGNIKDSITEDLIMKRMAKMIVLAAVLVMCFMLVACMGCGSETPVEPDTSEMIPSESVSEPATENGSENLTGEEADYQAWKELEVSQPAFGETGANISAGELLERAVTIEEFIVKYPESQYRDEAVEHYNKLVTAAITGGYEGEGSGNHLYLDDNGETFSADVVTEYDTFVNNYGDTHTATLVKEYTTLIGDADGSLTEDVKNFYKDLVNRLKDMFSLDNLNEGMNGGSAGGNNDNNEAGTSGGNNQNDTMGTQGNTGSGNHSGQSVQ